MPISLPQAATITASAFRTLERPFSSDFVRTALHSQVEALSSFSSLRPDVERLCGLLGRQKVADHEARIALLALEGRIWAQMMREGSAAEAIGQGRDALGVGKGVIDVAGIERAHRFVRSPFIESFLAATGRQPHGGAAFHVRRTKLDLFQSEKLSERLGRPVFFKREDHQPVGSFKIRGATNMILHALLLGMDPARMRVGTASHGNHAQGVVRAALNFGIPPDQIDIYLPVNASPLKRQQLRDMGVRVIDFGDTFEEAEVEVQRVASGNPNYLFLPAFDNGFVSMGQGTIGVEIDLQTAEKGITRYAVVVPAGGGGLIAGIATFLAPGGVRVIGVESESHPYVSLSFRKKEIVEPPAYYHVETDADGIALQRIGRAGFPKILEHVRDVIAVPEELIRGALGFLADEGHKDFFEGAPAVAVAALLYGALSTHLADLPSEVPLVLVVSGRNIASERLEQIVEAHGGRRWIDLDPKKRMERRVRDDLTSAGFMKDGVVLTLENARRGIELVRRVVAILDDPKSDLDLIDVIERLNWGPVENPKRINGTLRSLGLWREREGMETKQQALFHPYDNRATVVIGLADHPDLAHANQILQGEFWTVQRLLVEMVITEFFIDEERGWTERIGKEGETSVDTGRHRERLRLNNRMLQDAMGKLAGRLGVTVADFETMTEGQYRGLFQSA